MTEAQANGHEISSEQAGAAQNQAMAHLNGLVQTAIGVTVRGLLGSIPPGTPPDLVLNLAAFHLGNLMATSVMADLKVQFELRKNFKSAFAEGVGKAPMKAPAGQPAPAMSMPIDLKG